MVIVILDTNTYIKNTRLTGSFEVLFDYLEKTESHILLPKVVRDEIPVVYKRRLSEEVSKARSAFEKINRLLDAKVTFPSLDIDRLTDDFFLSLNSKLRQYSQDYIMPYYDGFLEETARRAIHKIKPCSVEKEEFRDTMLWLSVLKAAETNPDKGIVFVSCNTTDFCDKDGKLDPQLAKEILDKNLNVHFYNSLELFIQEHAQAITDLTPENITQAIDANISDSEFIDSIELHYAQRLHKALERKYDHANIIQFLSIFRETESFYCYDLANKSRNIYVELFISIEIEAEVEESGYNSDGEYRGVNCSVVYPQIGTTARLLIKVDSKGTFLGYSLIDLEVN